MSASSVRARSEDTYVRLLRSAIAAATARWTLSFAKRLYQNPNRRALAVSALDV